MQMNRSRVSPRVLEEMARKVNDHSSSEDPLADRPRLAALRTQAVFLLIVVWILLLAAAPLVALLLLFRVNYTVQWLAAGLDLLTISLALVGLYVIAVWALGARPGERRGSVSLLAGAGLLTAALASGLFLASQSSEAPLWVRAAATILSGLLVFELSLYISAVDMKHAPFFRLIFLVGALCFGVSLMIEGASIAQFFPESASVGGFSIDETRSSLLELGVPLMLLSNLGNWFRKGDKRS